MGPLKDLNDSELIVYEVIPLIIQDQFYTIQNLQRSPIPTNQSGTFFAGLTANWL